MTRDVLAKLTPEELSHHQLLTARRAALELNPRAFEAEESVRIVLDLFRQETKLLEKYEAPDDEYVSIDVTNGVLHFTEE
jgi:surfactin synthase thioesterase subunit